MIVEFAGCSGSGKSTLLEELVMHCRERNLTVVTVPQALLRWIPAVAAQQPTLQNLMLDAAGICRRVGAAEPYGDFLKFAIAAIRRDTDRVLRRLNCYRGVLRALGVHRALSREEHRPQIVLVDEGTVNSAHGILAHVCRPPRAEDIDAFCRLVPMPDLIVHVTAPLDLVLARTRRRPDPPLLHRTREDRERFIRHAHEAFERMASHAALLRNTLTVFFEDDDRRRYGSYARTIVEQLPC